MWGLQCITLKLKSKLYLEKIKNKRSTCKGEETGVGEAVASPGGHVGRGLCGGHMGRGLCGGPDRAGW